jgi:phosphopantothenoylcysteine decarboxylase/phosphopantothenate--cysteine ligase
MYRTTVSFFVPHRIVCQTHPGLSFPTVTSLRSKKILLGITGSIAAYKSAQLVRLLIKEGAEVRVIMTDSAREFITPLTLSTLSKNPVLSAFTDSEKSGVWNNHVEHAIWADVMIIAPASANTLAKAAAGMCDNFLMATYLSMRSEVFFAPAMDLDMLQHPATQSNLEKLRSYGHYILDPGYGELASGLIGNGRMAEPEQIVEQLTSALSRQVEATGKKVLITAGPTRENLDPVRFLSNHSSGKMGYALAQAFQAAGAQVSLISGPVQLPPPGVTEFVKVQSASEMYTAVASRFKSADLVIFAAAVADYTPAAPAALSLRLSKTVDIAGTLGKEKQPGQLLVGFALETNNEIENARAKLKRKNFDFIVLNSLNDSGAGFEHDTNKVVVIDKDENIRYFDLKPKKEVASDLLTIILDKWKKD